MNVDTYHAFQFHKGAIGVTQSEAEKLVISIFQFHKGAIGVLFQIEISNMAGEFQFHKGAIGVTVRNRNITSWRNFNSIKVRLEYIAPANFLFFENISIP